VKIARVSANNRLRSFEVCAGATTYRLPWAALRLVPGPSNRIVACAPDPELGCEAFTYRLADGREDSVHLDAVLEYNRDPETLRVLLLHRLTVAARARLEASGLSHREVARRLATSASQFYRLLDPANTSKSLDAMLGLLHVLGCEVEVLVRERQRA
jgi:hypothetical protein